MSERQQGLADRISEVKLQRIEELNARLRDTLERERVSAKSACESIVVYTQATSDYLVPYIWKLPSERNKYQQYQRLQALRRKGGETVGCCTIM